MRIKTRSDAVEDFPWGETATEVHGYKLQQPIGFLAKHIEKAPRKRKPKSNTKPETNSRAKSK